jgi:tRNA (guanine-N7-)-methyltransferase
MSNKNKLQRFLEVQALPNVLENQGYDDPHVRDAVGKRIDIKGRWNSLFFKNEQPIVLELACGKGEYTIALAQQDMHRNFIGIDIKGARLWKGATYAHEHGMTNVGFLRTRIEMINTFFAKGEVDEIWITFPDPFLRESKSNRRLTSHPFLDRYTRILRPGAQLTLITDDDSLFQFTLDVLNERKDYMIGSSTWDLYEGQHPDPDTTLLTYYERQHLAAGKTIKKVTAIFQ